MAPHSRTTKEPDGPLPKSAGEIRGKSLDKIAKGKPRWGQLCRP